MLKPENPPRDQSGDEGGLVAHAGDGAGYKSHVQMFTWKERTRKCLSHQA